MTPPLIDPRHLRFVTDELWPLSDLLTYPRFGAHGLDTFEAILELSQKLALEKYAPHNRASDVSEPHFVDGRVEIIPDVKAALDAYAEAGFTGLLGDEAEGGLQLPYTLCLLSDAMFMSANVSTSGYTMLARGVASLLKAHGNEDQKRRYRQPILDGRFFGTMCLSEPQAGSSLSDITTRAEPQADGSYRLVGQKMWISGGDHDLSDNIIHLVLARIPGSPAGVKGISLFIVPKFLLNADGTPGARNDVHCVSIEHKLGIKASPTAVLQFGDHGGAVGQLIGQENRGLEYMFIMMNAARYAVGVQGIAVAERAYQAAVAYAKDRVQSRPVDGSLPGSGPIIHHPDVKRMLMTMRAYTEGCRALASVAAAAFDAAHHHPDAATRQQNQAFYEFMVPLVKGYSTEMSLEVTSLGVQVHGGMGFIEETGAAQYYRDAKILTIYEGTTAIQANDLVGRKTSRDGGQTAKAIAEQILATEHALAKRDSAAARAMHKRLSAARLAFLDVVDFIAANTRSQPNAAFAGSVPYLMLAGNLMAGWQMARALLAAERLLAAGEGDPAFLAAKVATARFYGEHILTRIPGLRDAIVEGADSVTALALDAF